MSSRPPAPLRKFAVKINSSYQNSTCLNFNWKLACNELTQFFTAVIIICYEAFLVSILLISAPCCRLECLKRIAFLHSHLNLSFFTNAEMLFWNKNEISFFFLNRYTEFFVFLSSSIFSMLFGNTKLYQLILLNIVFCWYYSLIVWIWNLSLFFEELSMQREMFLFSYKNFPIRKTIKTFWRISIDWDKIRSHVRKLSCMLFWKTKLYLHFC